MKAFGFLAAFGKQKVEDGVQSVTTYLTSIDPEAATDAQLTLLKEKRDDYARRLVVARRALAKDKEETAVIVSEIDQSKRALGVLQGSMDGASASQKKKTLVKARTVATRIEELQVELEREEREDAQAQEMVDAIQKLYDQMDGMLKQAGNKLQEAERRMETAKSDAEHAQMMAEVNGAHESFGGINVALDAMNSAAEQAEEQAEVARMTTASSEDGAENLIDDILAADAKASDPDADDPFRSLK